MIPKEVISKWVEAFNSADVEALEELYSADAINHQMPNQPVIGRSAIGEMFRHDFAKADMHCIIENIFQDDEWAILEWSDPNGLRGCGFFHVIDGLIQTQRGYWDKLTFLKLQNIV